MPTAVLADEILTPGEGQVRALINVGGNPLVAWPNQAKVERALASLDLLVCIDIKMSQTAQLADYVLAPQVSLERDDIATAPEVFYEEPYAHYTEAVVAPQGDVLDEWEIYWELARRLGTPILTAGGPLPMDRKPDKFTVLAVTCSTEAAISLTVAVSSSEETDTDSTWLAVSFNDAAIWLRPLSVPSSDRIWLSAPSDTSSAIRTIALAVAATCWVWAVTSRGSRAACLPFARPFAFDVRLAMGTPWSRARRLALTG